MSNFKNLKIYGAVGLIISALSLGGCGSTKDDTLDNAFISDDIVVDYRENADSIIINEETNLGFDGKTYRDFLSVYGNEFDSLSLNNAALFDFSHLSDLDIKELSISLPNSTFDFNSLSNIRGIEKLEISINESANVKSLFEYIKNNDLSGIDLSIKLLDINSSILFAEQLKNNQINAASVTITSEFTDFYRYMYNVRTLDLKISRICNTTGMGDIEMQLSKVTNTLYYEYINNGTDITIIINNLIITSNNSEVIVTIEKTNSLNLIISEDAKLSAPEGTTVEIDKANVLILKED